MTKESLMYGFVGLVLGVVLSNIFMTTQRAKPASMMPDGKMMMNDGSQMSMNGMVDALKGKTGDDFDKTFLALMIEHHQGAVDMAKKVQINAKHKELKTLASDIIEAQTKEIGMMKDWWQSWGYGK